MHRKHDLKRFVLVSLMIILFISDLFVLDVLAYEETSYTYTEKTREQVETFFTSPNNNRDFYISSSYMSTFNKFLDNAVTYDTRYIMYISAVGKSQPITKAVTYMYSSSLPMTTYLFKNIYDKDSVRVQYLSADTNRMGISLFYNSITDIYGTGCNSSISYSSEAGVYYNAVLTSAATLEIEDGFDYVVETVKLVDVVSTPTPSPTPSPTPIPTSTATPTPTEDGSGSVTPSPQPTETPPSSSGSSIIEDLKNWFAELSTVFTNIVNTIQVTIGGFIDTIFGLLSQINEFLGGFVGNLISGLTDMLVSLFTVEDTYFDFKVARYSVMVTEKMNNGNDLSILKSANEGVFGDISSVYDGQSIKFVDFSQYKKYQSYFRKWIDGFFSILLVLYNMNQLLFMIRGTYMIKIGGGKKVKDE